jgi:CheY-like chemotaxis protein
MGSEPILIVDDNPTNLKLLVMTLSGLGYELRTAEDAERAIESIRERRPRLILMDLQLPGMGGLELTERLKRDPATRDIAVIAVTAYAMDGDRQRALDAGCDAFVTKPIDVLEFPELVTRSLGSGSG